MGGLLSSMAGWLTGTGAKTLSPEQLGSDADIPEPTSGLTPREIAYIRSTWALVKPDLRSHGVQFFLLMFKTHPHLQQKFKSFATVKFEDLSTNKRLAAHGTTVMSAIDSYIENLDDVTIVVEMLKTTGHNHKQRKITVNDFELLNPVLVKYLSDSLGSAMSEEAKAAWQHLLNVIVSVVASSYE